MILLMTIQFERSYELNIYQFFFLSFKVQGRYSVWLPDGRLMTVDYTAAKETGFVPQITYTPNANPFQGKK